MRFAGDSGDGMQLTGGQFTLSTALAGNDLATFPDFPAEIRAPQGTTFGVSAFQINFGSTSIDTAGDAPDVLMAMNPAALKVNLAELRPSGLIIADTGAFDERNLEKAGYASNPLEDGQLAPYQVVAFDITRLTLEAVKPFGLEQSRSAALQDMWALGLALWMFDRDRGAADRLAEDQIRRQERQAGRRQYRRAQCRACLWRDRRNRRTAASSSRSRPRRWRRASTAR